MIRTRTVLLLLCLSLSCLAGCRGKRVSFDPATARAVREGSLVPLGSFLITFYWIPEEGAFPGPKKTPLYGTGGEEIGRFSAGFAEAARLEGCGILTDGRRITARTRKAWRRNEPGFAFTDAPYGEAADGRPLRPLHSAAVDPRVIPRGTKLYIHKTNGVIVSGGRVATGSWEAHDTGSAIRGKHIDLFVGSRSAEYAFEARGLISGSKVEVFRIVGRR